MLMLEGALKDLHWDYWPGHTHGDSVSRALHAAGFGENSNPGKANETVKWCLAEWGTCFQEPLCPKPDCDPAVAGSKS